MLEPGFSPTLHGRYSKGWASVSGVRPAGLDLCLKDPGRYPVLLAT